MVAMGLEFLRESNHINTVSLLACCHVSLLPVLRGQL